MDIVSILREGRGPRFSIEVYPPRTSRSAGGLSVQEHISRIFDTVEHLLPYRPAFVSVTYNPEGQTRSTSIPIAGIIRQRFGIEAVAHLTALGTPPDEIPRTLEVMDYFGIQNVLAIRGDPPQGAGGPGAGGAPEATMVGGSGERVGGTVVGRPGAAGPGAAGAGREGVAGGGGAVSGPATGDGAGGSGQAGMAGAEKGGPGSRDGAGAVAIGGSGRGGPRISHASELVALIKKHRRDFCVGVACYPEGHPECVDAGGRRDLEKDLGYFREKVEAGAGFAITQLFLDNSRFFSFLERARRAGIEIPIVPGIMPVVSLQTLGIVKRLCGAEVPSLFLRRIEAAAGDPGEVRERGIEHALEQCRGLVDRVPCIHFYAMNRWEPVERILKGLI
ncbi:MAG: methylenetetrahydrofolate reductase [Thermoplasmata archaeon]